MGFKEKLKDIPDEAGVYIFKDKQGQILYVGKAVSLRKRVRSYSYTSGKRSPKVQALIDRIEDIDCIITASETEALILESNLIKEHQPKYNISLRDDKNYPLL
ncbi:MAG: GIY-YIG nuclease family protein, partial [Candidatus Omnitrophica bacterium]|nr:GIY-YIG nuclease family protein [Candidatus Omnitrophota bacterium]